MEVAIRLLVVMVLLLDLYVGKSLCSNVGMCVYGWYIYVIDR